MRQGCHWNYGKVYSYSTFLILKKVKRRLWDNPVVCISMHPLPPSVNFSINERIFNKLGKYIMPPKSIETTYFTIYLICLCVYIELHSDNEYTHTTIHELSWASGQSSWLQIQRSEFDFRQYPIFLQVMERGPISLVSIFEKLFRRKSIDSGLEIREYGHSDLSRWPRGI
jgi:hypothetical protein